MANTPECSTVRLNLEGGCGRRSPRAPCGPRAAACAARGRPASRPGRPGRPDGRGRQHGRAEALAGRLDHAAVARQGPWRRRRRDTATAAQDAGDHRGALTCTCKGMGGGRAGVVELAAALRRGWIGGAGWTLRGNAAMRHAPLAALRRRTQRPRMLAPVEGMARGARCAVMRRHIVPERAGRRSASDELYGASSRAIGGKEAHRAGQN